MLQLYKNQVLTEAALEQVSVRQAELDFYCNSYWVWGGTSTVMAGFVFAQLTNPVPDGTNFYLEMMYLVCVSTCLGLNLYIITVTTLCCIWGPGMALRGSDGMRSFHLTCDFMKENQNWIYITFTTSIVAYFGFTLTLLWLYPSRASVNTLCNIMLTLFLLSLGFMLVRLELRVGTGFILDHRGPEGRIQALDRLADVGDLDHVVSKELPEFHEGYVGHLPGLTSFRASPRII